MEIILGDTADTMQGNIANTVMKDIAVTVKENIANTMMKDTADTVEENIANMVMKDTTDTVEETIAATVKENTIAITAEENTAPMVTTTATKKHNHKILTYCFATVHFRKINKFTSNNNPQTAQSGDVAQVLIPTAFSFLMHSIFSRKICNR